MNVLQHYCCLLYNLICLVWKYQFSITGQQQVSKSLKTGAIHQCFLSFLSLIFHSHGSTQTFSLLRSNCFQMCLILSAFLVSPFSSSPSCVFLSLPSSFRRLTVSRCVFIPSLSLCQFFCSSSSLSAFIFPSSFFFFTAAFQSPLSLSLTHSRTLLVRLCCWSLLMFSLSGARAICDSNVRRRTESIRQMSWGGGVTAKAAH